MVGMVDQGADQGSETCVMCRLHSAAGEPEDMVRLEHPSFGIPVLADRAFARTCGGGWSLANRIAATVGDPSAAALPMRFAFARGRGEDYELHVAHIDRRGDTVIVRRFRPDDPVVSRFRFPRERQSVATPTGGAGA